jgi:hypothetical protein
MPYKDSQHKKEWERQHRPQRLARRRELRRIEAAPKEDEPEALQTQDSGASFLLPVVAGSALAACNPKLAMGVGGTTILVAAFYKKGWTWWIVGILILVMGVVMGVFFQWKDQNTEK